MLKKKICIIANETKEIYDILKYNKNKLSASYLKRD